MKQAFVLCFILLTQSIMADQSDELFSMSLEELLQIKVTGSTLTQENLLSVPAAVTVFSYDEIKRMGLDYLDELANLVPGFQSYRSAQSPLENPISSRGRLNSLEAPEILVMVDGQRVDGPRSNGTTVAYPKYTLAYIERVEFIRGPGSAVYGSNAMMGVINIITRSNVNEVSIAAGSFNRETLNVQTSHDFGQVHMDLFAQRDRDKGEDYRLQDTFSSDLINTDDPRKTDDITLKANWKDTSINLQHHQFEAENFYELAGISNGINHRDGSLQAIAIKQKFNWLDIESWLQVDHKETNVTLIGQLTPTGFLNALSTPASNDALFVEAKFHHYTESRVHWHNALNITDKSDLQFGFELRHVDAPQTIARNNFDIAALASGNFPIAYYDDMLPTTSVQEKSKRHISAQYIQLQHALFERTDLTLGIRNDDFNQLGSQVTPRLAIVYGFDNPYSIKLLYGEAFRVPSESELHLSNNPVLLGNPDLEPEIVKTWDLILVGQMAKSTFSLGYFENHFTDAIAEAPSSLGTPQFQNTKQNPAKGFEFELSQELSQSWFARATYTNIIESPDESFRQATEFGSLAMNYQNGKWNCNIISTWHGEQELAALDGNGHRKTLSDKTMLNAKVNYHYNTEWEGALHIKNMMDKDDYAPALGAALTEGVANRGREVLFSVKWSY
jgi:outer membrane cobalamin receptor